MAEVSVKQLATDIDTPVDRLLQQFVDAGIDVRARLHKLRIYRLVLPVILGTVLSLFRIFVQCASIVSGLRLFCTVLSPVRRFGRASLSPLCCGTTYNGFHAFRAFYQT